MPDRIDLRDDGMIGIRCDFGEKDLVKAMGASWDPLVRCWTIGFSIDNVNALMKSLRECQIGERAKAAYDAEKAIEKNVNAIKALCKKDEPYCLRVPGLNATLFNYQKLAVAHCIQGFPGFLLAAEMGTGKTVMAISMALLRKARGEIKNCLIITPAAVKWNWDIEIKKFTNESVAIIDGKEEDRIKLWLDETPFFKVVNYEILCLDLFGGRTTRISEKDSAETIVKKRASKAKLDHKKEVLSEIRKKGFDMVIADEVHYIKNHTSNRTSAVKSLPAKYRVGLTGTPVDGKLEEIHSIVEWLKPGVFPRLSKFLDRYATRDIFGRVRSYRHVDEVHRKIDTIVLRQRKKDILKDLPDKVYKDIFVELSNKERSIYEAIRDGNHPCMDSVNDPECLIEDDAKNMVAAIHCAQLCDHPSLVGEKDVDSSKFKILVELLEAVIRENGHKVVLFSRFKKMTDILCERLGELGYNYLYICGETSSKDRAEYQEVFAKDETIHMCIGTEAMSTGLNLVAADYVINYDDSWQPSIMLQREDRCHRVTTKGSVTVVNLICKDTVEERVKMALKRKQSVADKVLDEAREDTVIEYQALNDSNIRNFL